MKTRSNLRRRQTTALSQAQPAPPTPASNSVPVTADNIIRAESDAVFSGLVAQRGFGKFYHNRELTPPDSRIVRAPTVTRCILRVCLTSMPGR